MAKKPATAHADEIPPAMDYAQHEGTYRGFIEFVKWSIVAMVLTVLSLYAFIEGHAPIIGTLLLLAIPVLIIGAVVLRSRRT
ncbi:aa3-type cytochrome c oxidase subunit IV [Devosia sp. ZB163]|uniref:aa3-type cytochrome c oxidase subunit IV n=1 Tax=Devosia sp. ZB163 TaxID=3025938 RepID=UPI00236226CA|nr:aa3-type cytochrome c oxidase subunit IV [Devosia sp. ZB163]MDC9825029.1 aa3-type cytochrome c oxidase subunit IV [Devosia sp. ZB163]